MMDSMIIGKYVPGSSLVHRLDPRTKLITIFLFVCIVFLANNVQTYALLGLFTVGVVSLTRVPFSFLMKGLKANHLDCHLYVPSSHFNDT